MTLNEEIETYLIQINLIKASLEAQRDYWQQCLDNYEPPEGTSIDGRPPNITNEEWLRYQEEKEQNLIEYETLINQLKNLVIKNHFYFKNKIDQKRNAFM